MALFFDTAWFDTRLKALGLTRDDLARAAGWPRATLDSAFKDQTEVPVDIVAIWAALLGAPPEAVASACGISTPVPRAPDPRLCEALAARVVALERRLARLEGLVAGLNLRPQPDGD